MSCSRVSWFFAATAIRRNARLHVRRAPPAPSRPAAVGVAAPDRVHLGEVGVVAPVAGVDQRQQARAVRAGLGAEDPGGGAPPVAVLARRPRRRARAGSSPRRARPARRPSRTASSSSATTCGNASRKKPEMRTVTSMRGRPSSSARHDLEAGDPPRRVVPDRPAAEQREDLGDVVALGTHRRRAPDGQADADAGTSPVSARWRASSESASATPDVPASGDGIAFGSTE